MRSSRRTAAAGGGERQQSHHGLRRQVAPPVVYSPEVGPTRVGRRFRRAGDERGEAGGGGRRASKNEHVKRIQSLLGNIRTSTALLEAYGQDGWRGTKCVADTPHGLPLPLHAAPECRALRFVFSREKLQPKAELQKARQRIAQAKVGAATPAGSALAHAGSLRRERCSRGTGLD